MSAVSQQALAGMGGGLTGVQYIGKSESAAPSTSWAFPAGWQAGDFLVCNFMGQTSPQTTPVGWTDHIAYNVSNFCVGWHRLLDGSESGSIPIVADGYGYGGQMGMWRGVGAKIATAAFGSWTATSGGSSAPSPRTITVSGNAPMLLVGSKFAIGSGGTLTIAMSPAADGDLGVLNAYWDARTLYKLYGAGSTPANNTVTGGDNGNANGLMAGYFRFT